MVALVAVVEDLDTDEGDDDDEVYFLSVVGRAQAGDGDL